MSGAQQEAKERAVQAPGRNKKEAPGLVLWERVPKDLSCVGGSLLFAVDVSPIDSGNLGAGTMFRYSFIHSSICSFVQ